MQSSVTNPQPPIWRRWLGFLLRVKDGIERDHLPIAAGGVAFFLMLGIFPGLAALFSIYSWLADPAQIERQLEMGSGILPTEVYQILHAQMERLAGNEAGVGWGAALGIALALWAGSRAMKGLIQGLNIVFSQSEKRGFLSLQIASLVLTLTLIVVVAAALMLIAVIPVMIAMLPREDVTLGIFSLLRWPILLGIAIFLLALVYRFGPSHNRSSLKWFSPGAIVATLLWLAASALFSYYVGNFGSYHAMYGSLGAVAILMLWLYLTAFLILLGAEIDETLRRQQPTRKTEVSSLQVQV